MIGIVGGVVLVVAIVAGSVVMVMRQGANKSGRDVFVNPVYGGEQL